MVHIIAKVRRLNEKSIDSGSKLTLCQMSGLTSCITYRNNRSPYRIVVKIKRENMHVQL